MIEDLDIGEPIPTISYVICRLRAWHWRGFTVKSLRETRLITSTCHEAKTFTIIIACFSSLRCMQAPALQPWANKNIRNIAA